MRVETGLDRIAAGDQGVLRRLRGRRIGLCAHPASVTRELRHARDVFMGAGLEVCALFGPEHGFGGEAQDMTAVADGGASAHAAGLPVHSLYGAHEDDLAPRPAQLAGLDVVVVDLQDVGSRYYTFAWTAVHVLCACARAGIETVILDRPNPLGGVVVEGAPQRPGYRSFVGLHDVAVRHGMTIAELCRLAAGADRIDPAAWHVVPMRGWAREMTFDATGLPWVCPSPNMPTFDTARVYPGGCLVEGTLLSEGRGTTRPFEIWGAPGLHGAALARRVAIDGAVLRPLTFQPTFHKHAGVLCGGVQVHVTDAARFRPYAAYLRMLSAARDLMGERMCWRTEPYEFVADRPAIDLLTGGPEYRSLVDAGADLGEWLAEDQAGAEAFAGVRREHLLY